MSIFLSRDDVATLTGRQRKADQAAQLHVMGIPFHVSATGWPIVTCAAVEGRESKMVDPEPAMNL